MNSYFWQKLHKLFALKISDQTISVLNTLYHTLKQVCDLSIDGISRFIAVGVEVMQAKTTRGWQYFNHLMRRNKGRLIIY